MISYGIPKKEKEPNTGSSSFLYFGKGITDAKN